MQENTTTLLLFNIKEERLQLFKNFLDENNIRLVRVRPLDYLNSIGSIINLPNFEKSKQVYLGKDFDEEMMVMVNFNDELMNKFFSYFKENKIPSVKLKAVLTPTNAYWNALNLYKELLSEYNYYVNRKQSVM